MKKIILFAAVAGILATACVSAQQTTPKKDIALQLYSLREAFDANFDTTIIKVGKMGYTAVEAANYYNGKFYGKTPEEFKAAVEAAGMRVLSSHIFKILSDKELKSKDFSESLAWWDNVIAAHLAAGMTYIVQPRIEVPETLNDLQTYCDYFNAIGERCRQNGLSFGYHNHSHEFTKVEDVMMYDYMLEHTNPELVFFEMDVYWTVIGKQSPVDYFHKYPGRFTILHIKDHRELGQSGMVGFDAIFNNTDVAGTKHLVVEMEEASTTPEEGIKQCLDYLLNCPLVKERYAND
jgi:sugar phosphate isomerase/epimerase